MPVAIQVAEKGIAGQRRAGQAGRRTCHAGPVARQQSGGQTCGGVNMDIGADFGGGGAIRGRLGRQRFKGAARHARRRFAGRHYRQRFMAKAQAAIAQPDKVECVRRDFMLRQPEILRGHRQPCRIGDGRGQRHDQTHPGKRHGQVAAFDALHPAAAAQADERRAGITDGIARHQQQACSRENPRVGPAILRNARRQREAGQQAEWHQHQAGDEFRAPLPIGPPAGAIAIRCVDGDNEHDTQPRRHRQRRLPASQCA